MSKHTEGPWASKAIPGAYAITSPSGKIIAMIPMRASAEHNNADADADLFASAPDMLSDLHEAARLLRRYEQIHRAKDTEESTAKADVNAGWAARFENTIARAEGAAK